MEKLRVDRSLPGGQSYVASKFKKFDHPRPYVTVIGFAMDSQGRFPIFFRSDKVRSAKNAWSMPSGLHEVGYSYGEQFGVELGEELNLEPISPAKKIGYYEAIIYGKNGEDNWHWVMLMMAMRVKTLDTLANKEPEKHSDIQIITVAELFDSYISRPWTMGLKEALVEHKSIIEQTVIPVVSVS